MFSRRGLLIFCVGDREHGMGHVVRCLVLARALMTVRGARVDFVTLAGTPGAARIVADGGFSHLLASNEGQALEWLVERGRCYIALLIDVEHGPSRAFLQAVRPYYSRIITLGGVGYACHDPEAQAEFVDLRIVQSVLLDEPVGHERVLSGVEYIAVSPEYAACRPGPDGHIVVAMGGGDPHGLTEIAADGLQGIGRRVVCVTGPARKAANPRPVGPRQHIEWQHGLPSLAPVLDGAAMCVCALGMTAYEALAAGVPVVMTNWSADHKRTATELAVRGVGLSLGLWNVFTQSACREAVQAMLAEPESWRERSRKGRELVDGHGAERCVQAILELL